MDVCIRKKRATVYWLDSHYLTGHTGGTRLLEVNTMAQFALAQDTHKKWLWILTFGILQVLLGCFAIAFVGVTSMVSVVYLGVLFMVTGISEIIYAIRTRHHGDMWFHLFFGVLTAVCGFFIFNNPLANLVVLTILIATLFIVTGTVTLIMAIMERFPNWGWFAVNGAVSIGAGYFIFLNPIEASLWLIGFLVGTQMLFRGFAWISLGWTGRTVTAPTRPARA